EFYATPRIRIFSFYMPAGDDPASHRAEVMTRMAEIARRAAERGVTLMLENERGIYGDTAARVLDILESVNSPGLSHAFDPANYLEVGQPIDEAWTMLRPRGGPGDRRGMDDAPAAGGALPRQGLRAENAQERPCRRGRRSDPATDRR